MTFQELNLEDSLLQALKEEGYNTPTPIQSQSIPYSLQGRDLLACAQTGTGKTAAFALPILQRLHGEHLSRLKERPIKALVLTPTRELAIQIEESFKAYGRHIRLRKLVIFGGVGQNPQVEALQQGVDILVATPGRLLDLINQGFISLKDIEIFVLDEADRMLDMGFIHDVRRVIKLLPVKRQTLFFSATMPPEIAKLAEDILTDPVKVAVTPVSSTVEVIEQSVYFVDKKQKKNLLLHLLNTRGIGNALVFTRTKHGANRVVQDLTRAGVRAMAIHGNKSQSARQQALQSFKAGEIRVLVATDIAARGIDIEDLSHVVNFDIPNIPETYVHRIGRTGRAGASGIAISFCDEEEKTYLKDIQKLIGKKVAVAESHPFPLGMVIEEREDTTSQNPQQHRDSRTSQRSANRQRTAKPENRKPTEVPAATKNQQEGSNRPSSSSRHRKNRRGRQSNGQPVAPAEQTNQRPVQSRQVETKKREQPVQQPMAVEKKEQPARQPDTEKTEKQKEQKRQWSSSIFIEPGSGKKGFTIKSDRDEQRNRTGDRGSNRKGRKR